MRAVLQYVRENLWILFFIGLTILGIIVLTVFIIAPAYKESSSKIYTSKLGHPSMLRKAGTPLPVKTVKAQKTAVTIHVMGEGVCSSKPLLVPIVPMAPVLEVLVEEGERVKKGQLLATLDDAKAVIKRDSARLALSTAQAELERVRLGSAYVLAQERPDKERLNKASILAQKDLVQEKLNKFQDAYDKGVISLVKLLEVKSEFTQISERYEQAQLSTTAAVGGVEESKKIAQNAVADARQALAHREEELKAFRVHAPADGVIDQALINAGEYNQESGKPGFLISSGLWFDAYFDQSDFKHVKKGLEAVISLESHPGNGFPAIVKVVKPIVSFNSGGPEISRPLRPRGSGSPEWAATFKSKLEFTGEGVEEAVITGMTGFARIGLEREALTVPRAAVLSISAGHAVVYVAQKSGDIEMPSDDWHIRSVKVGHVSESYAEILEGLEADEEVMIDGHWTLKEDDKIKVRN